MELARRRMKPRPADCNAVLRARMKKDGLPCMLAGGLSECIQRPLQLAHALKEHEHPPALPPDVILAQHHGRPLLQPIGHEANLRPECLCARESVPQGMKPSTLTNCHRFSCNTVPTFSTRGVRFRGRRAFRLIFILHLHDLK